MATSTSSTARPTNSAVAGSTDTGAPLPSDQSGHQGLSTSAKVAIGVVLSVVAVIAFVVYIFRRRRHQAKQNPNPEIESNPTYSLGKGPITGAPSGSTLVAASYSHAASASHPQLNAMGDSSTYPDQYLSKPELPADFITPIPKIPEG